MDYFGMPFQSLFQQSYVPSQPVEDIPLIGDVVLDVTVEFGRTFETIQDILKIGPGTTLQLDKKDGDALDIYVNHKLVARGEVVLINDEYGIRVSEILSS